MNFFQPQMKLVEKDRDGARLTRRYDVAKTPYQRLMDSPHVDTSAKAKLTKTYRKQNPAELKRQIARCQDRLLTINRTKPDPGREVGTPLDHPFRMTVSWRQRSRTFPMSQPVEPSRTS